VRFLGARQQLGRLLNISAALSSFLAPARVPLLLELYAPRAPTPLPPALVLFLLPPRIIFQKPSYTGAVDYYCNKLVAQVPYAGEYFYRAAARAPAIIYQQQRRGSEKVGDGAVLSLLLLRESLNSAPPDKPCSYFGHKVFCSLRARLIEKSHRPAVENSQ
jgi:hypothetical protein